MPNPETLISNAIMRAMAGRRDVRLHRNNVGEGKLANGSYVSWGQPGSCDLEGWLLLSHVEGRLLTTPLAVPLLIEVKTPTGRVRPGQRDHEASAHQYGCCHIIARSPADAVDGIAAFQRRHSP